MFSRSDIEHYFDSFKQQQLFLIILGAVAVITALIFYIAVKTQWHKGFALPLAVFAMLFCGAGFNNYKKTEQLRIRSVYSYDMHPERLKTTELDRMNNMKQNLQVLVYVNISIIIASFFIFLYFKKKAGNEYYMGAAASLFLMAVISITIYSAIIKSTTGYSKRIENYNGVIIKRVDR